MTSQKKIFLLNLFSQIKKQTLLTIWVASGMLVFEVFFLILSHALESPAFYRFSTEIYDILASPPDGNLIIGVILPSTYISIFIFSVLYITGYLVFGQIKNRNTVHDFPTRNMHNYDWIILDCFITAIPLSPKSKHYNWKPIDLGIPISCIKIFFCAKATR